MKFIVVPNGDMTLGQVTDAMYIVSTLYTVLLNFLKELLLFIFLDRGLKN